MNLIKKRDAKAQGLARYFTGKPCPRGHVSDRSVATGHCTECERARASSRRAEDPEKHREAVRASHARHAAKNREKHRADCRIWYRANRDRILSEKREEYAVNPYPAREMARVYRQKNADAVLGAQRESRRKNRAKINAQQSARRAANPERYASYNRDWLMKYGDDHNAKRRDRGRTDPIYAFNRRARCLIGGAIRRAGFRKAAKTEDLLGCTLLEFRAHIERQFLPGMGWHNMHLWEIDHIVPVSLAKTPEEAAALNKAGNLRPLWMRDNRKKQAKQTHLI